MKALFNNTSNKKLTLFIRIMIFCISICFVMAIIYGVFSVKTVYDELDNQLYLSNINLLMLTDTTAEMLMNGVEKTLYAVSENADIISAVVAPGLDKTQRNYDIVRYLNTIAESSNIVSKIFLYVSYDQTVYSSSGSANPLLFAPEKDLIDIYLLENKNYSAKDIINSEASLGNYNDDLVYCLDFPLNGPYSCGTLFFVIDQEALYRRLNSQTEFDTYIFMDNMSPLNATEEQSFSFTADELVTMSASGVGSLRKPGLSGFKVVYYYLSPSRWLYVYPVALNSLMQFSKGIIRTLFPLFILSLLFSGILSAYLSKSIYQPIRRLMELVGGNRKKWISSEETLGEMEFLGMAYTNAVNSNNQLENLVKNSTDALLEKTFLSLLHGREYEQKEIEETLRILKTPFSIEGNWLVILTSVTQKDNDNLNVIQTNLYRDGIDKIIDNISGSECSHSSVQIGIGTIAFILFFDSSVDAVHISDMVKRIVTALTHDISSIPYSNKLGIGNAYHSIFDLKYSYKEAEELLHYQYYINADTVQEITISNPSTPEYYHQRASQMAQALFSVQSDAADLSHRVIEDFFSADISLDEMQERVGLIVDAVYSFVGDELPDETDKITAKPIAVQEMQSCQSLTSLQSWIEKFCNNAAEYFGVCNSRKQYRYVTRAKDYIDEHYMDMNLSLNEIAEEINITPTYLSRIFKEYQQKNFTDYLNELRINHAELLLTTTGLSVSEIGFKCGFSSSQNFNRVFKKYKQITPGQYRDNKI